MTLGRQGNIMSDDTVPSRAHRQVKISLIIQLMLLCVASTSLSFAKLPPPCLVEAEAIETLPDEFMVKVDCHAQLAGKQLSMSFVIPTQADGQKSGIQGLKSFTDVVKGQHYRMDQSLIIGTDTTGSKPKLTLMIEMTLRSGMKLVQTVPVALSKSLHSPSSTLQVKPRSSQLVPDTVGSKPQDSDQVEGAFRVVPSSSTRKRSLRFYRAKRSQSKSSSKSTK